MKPKVHVSIEVRYTSQGETIYLVPGQVFPISFYRPEDRPKHLGWLGNVEIRVFASLWLGDKVYTDISDKPYPLDYFITHHLEETTNTHSTKYGYGVTMLDVSRSTLQGRFSNSERAKADYPISKVIKHESNAEYIQGGMCSMHLVPEIYIKLTEWATPRPGDVEFYDPVNKGVGKFRRIFIPVVLGEFDNFRDRNTPWRKKLLEEEQSPYAGKAYMLHTKIEFLRDWKTGVAEYEQKRNGDYIHNKTGYPYYSDYWYLGYATEKLPCMEVEYNPPIRRKIAILPLVDKHDILAPIDVGRKRIWNWEESLRALRNPPV